GPLPREIGPRHDRVGGAQIDADRLGHEREDGSAAARDPQSCAGSELMPHHHPCTVKSVVALLFFTACAEGSGFSQGSGATGSARGSPTTCLPGQCPGTGGGGSGGTTSSNASSSGTGGASSSTTASSSSTSSSTSSGFVCGPPKKILSAMK